MNPQTPVSADPVKEPPAEPVKAPEPAGAEMPPRMSVAGLRAAAESSKQESPIEAPISPAPQKPPAAPAPKPQPTGTKSPVPAIAVAVVLFVVLAGVAFYAYTSAK